MRDEEGVLSGIVRHSGVVPGDMGELIDVAPGSQPSVAAGDGRTAEVGVMLGIDLSLEMGGGLKHYACSGGRVAFCGIDLRGAHLCPTDLSCGCVVCPECARVDRRWGPTRCPLTSGPCECVPSMHD